MSTPTDLSEVDDLELTSRAREGEESAVIELWTRHYPAALSTARRVARQPRDAEELAADAFSGMLVALSTGGGPTGSVRSYLLTSVRNGMASRARRANASDVLTGENTVLENAAEVPRDPVAAHGELSLVREAFSALPSRWRHVLWRTAVEHESNITVAREMGLTPNAVAALARRARRGLRAAYVQVHVSRGAVDPKCLPFVGGLATLLTAPDDGGDVAEHVRGCARCSERLAELRRVDRNLAGVLTPAVLSLLPHEGAATALGAAAPGAGSAVASTAASRVEVLAAKAAVVVLSAAVAGWAAWPPSPARPAVDLAAPPVATMPASPIATSPTAPPRQATTTTSPHPTEPPPGRSATTEAPIPSTTLVPPQVAQPPPPMTQSTTTTTAAPVGHLSTAMAAGGPNSAPFFQVAASARELTSGLTLQLTVPAGVTLTGSFGDWTQCTQNGLTITCSAPPSTSQNWSGGVNTSWATGAQGTVRALVTGTYRSGSPAAASTATTWPHP